MGAPLPDAAPSLRASLAGVSRSTTVLVAYLMTVTELGWERCLAATRAVRSYVSPNFGFQQQLQEYEVTLLQEVCPTSVSPYICVCRACKQGWLFCMQLYAGPAVCLSWPLCVLFITWGFWGFACKNSKKALKIRKCLDIVQVRLKKLFKPQCFSRGFG